MRYLLFLALPFALAAQGAESDQRVTQALIGEIQQLRLAIERSTLLNARTQLAVSQLQLQEQSVARLTTQLGDVRARGAEGGGLIKRLAEEIQDTEQARAKATDPNMARALEHQIRESKGRLEQFTAMEAQRSAREGELATQLQQAQNQIAGSRARIEEMERALDAAIQQMLKR
jgi:predicted  nucleic acid-binding Zn-ribbon protein